ncbi:hypothetical protein [Thioalkalivibrio sp. HK1]|uniref:hypothetical protein n=1 Tax=Thioalkalivibrio sp. HK1 TaxID=1469245 RepID=UPI000471FDE9|nr:hypothetical protein [Thioalkalivibrio sp. HK1]
MAGIARTLSLVLGLLGASFFPAYGADGVASTDEEGSLILSTDGISVIEGGNEETLTIRLGSQPSEDVRVVYRQTSPHIQIRLPSPYYVAFTPSNWDVPQTIRVKAFDDADQVDYTTTVSFLSTAYETKILTVNVFDYASVAPAGEIALSPTSLSISETGQGRITVKLGVRPSAPVTISLTNVNPDISINPRTLTFTNGTRFQSGNWSEARVVDLSARKDSDNDDDSDTITLSASGGNYEGLSASTSITVVDKKDEGRPFDIQGSHEIGGLKMKEGETKVISFVATDGILPDVDTVVSLTNTNPDITLTPNSLTFRPASSGTLRGNLIQLVSVSAAQDSDMLDDSDIITLVGNIASSRRILVSVEDTTSPPEGALILSDGALSVDEGRTVTFTVKLDTRPSEDVQVSLTNTNPDITLSPALLTFTASNFDVVQTVTVSAAHDSDYRDERDTITLEASGGGGIYASARADKSVAIVDDDIGGRPVLSTTSLDIDEGNSKTFTVKLDRQPSDAISVSLANTNPDITVNPTSLTFTASNFDTAQTITVSAARDDDDQDDTDTITVSTAGFAPEIVEVSVDEDEVTAPVEGSGEEILLSPTGALALDEGSSKTLEVKLGARPSADVTIAIANENPDITPTPASLVFTASNFDTAQSVSVAAALDDDDADDTDTLTLSASGGGYDSISATKAISVIDIDSEGGLPGILVLSSTSLNLDEGSSKTFTVALDRQPDTDIPVSIGSTNPDITIAPTSLTFTPLNFDNPQVIDVEARVDDDRANDTDTITVSAPGFAPEILLIVVIDNTSITPAGEIVLSNTGELRIDEGATGTFTVALDTKPNADAWVSLSRSNRDIEISPSRLAFGASNWDVPQSVSITAKSDADTEDDFGTVILKATGGIAASPATLPIVIIDKTVILPETPGRLSLSPGRLVIGEGGSGTFTVALGVLPSADVTVSLTKTNPDIALSSTSLSFDASNWNAARTITVSAAHDSDGTDDTDLVELVASGSNYSDVRATKSITVSDGDIQEGIPGLVLSTRVLKITEGGSNTFTARLDYPPSGDIQLSLSSTNPDITPSPSELWFTSSNWVDRQSVVVSAREDSDSRYDAGTIIMSAKGDSRGFIDLPSMIVVLVNDTTPPESSWETGRLNLSTRTLAIREGESGTFIIALGVRPSTDVRVSLTKTNPDIVLSPAAPLLFTASNWHAPQTVTVKAMNDDDDVDDSDTITVTASGGNYDEVTAGKSITVADDDVEGGVPDLLVLSTTSMSVDEGASKRFSVKLGIPPSGKAKVFSMVSDADADITVSPVSLSFTDTNWNRWQSFTVNALQDRDATDDVALVVLKALGGVVASTKTILVTMVDTIADIPPPETGTLRLSPRPLEIEEGTSGTFTVALGVRPIADVSVSLVNTNPDIALFPEGPLFFTASNWNEAQTITATAAHDDDDRDDIDTLRLDASGGNYDGASADYSITVFDDDIEAGEGGDEGEGGEGKAPEIVLSRASLSVAEGGSQTFTVELDSRPSGTLSVIAEASAAGITLSPTSLSFTDSNWDRAQAITVSISQGSDVPKNGTITVSAAGLASKTLAVKVGDEPAEPPSAPEEVKGALVLSTRMLSIGEGEAGMFTVGLAIQPSRTVTISIDSDNPVINIDEARLYFTPSNWSATQVVSVDANIDEDTLDETATITLTAQGGNYEGVDVEVIVEVMDDDEPIALPSVDLPVKAQALALPPPTVQDSATMRVRCRSATSPCIVRFNCAAQDGTVLTGVLPWTIPPLGSMSFDSKEIAEIVGGSWEGKGRLGCELQSDAKLGSQVWTRSGNGVLVNNSASIRSAQEGTGYRADIESIPSPDSPEKSNIRIRCLAPPGASCTQVHLACFDDNGTEYPGTLDPIPSRSVRHLQTRDIADIIGHRWQGMGLSCELRSDQPFTAQVLTRTGGGGALVNNSATGAR